MKIKLLGITMYCVRQGAHKVSLAVFDRKLIRVTHQHHTQHSIDATRRQNFDGSKIHKIVVTTYAVRRPERNVSCWVIRSGEDLPTGVDSIQNQYVHY